MSESRAHQSGSSHIAAGTNPKSKPWLTPDEQMKHLRSQGVRFDLMSEKDAISYLAKNNNFFRLRSYRQGFARVVNSALLIGCCNPETVLSDTDFTGVAFPLP